LGFEISVKVMAKYHVVTMQHGLIWNLMQQSSLF